MKVKNIIFIGLLLLLAISLTFITTCTGGGYKTGAFVPFEYAVPDGMITDAAEKEAMIQAKLTNLRETNKIFWGELPGDTDVLLKIFANVYSFIRSSFAGFKGLDIDFNKIGDEGFQRIEEGLNDYGEFAYMLTYMGYVLREGHSVISTKRIDGGSGLTPFRKNVPLINTSKFSRIGVCVTVTQKEEIVVMRSVKGSDNPYNLKPGDEIVGFNGIPWSEWYPLLLETGIPIYGTPAASEKAARFRMLENAASNAMLFEKINIKRYGKEEIETLPIVFKPFSWGEYDACEEYFDNVSGVKAPKRSIWAGESEIMKDGIIKDKNIGYIYIAECPDGFDEFGDPNLWNPFETEFSKQFEGAIMRMKNTDGLILDLRLNLGGRNEVFYKGLTKLVKTEKDMPLFIMLDKDNEDPDMYALKLPDSKEKDVNFPADNENYTKPIVVLTRADCISAGDFLVALFARFPEFKIIGMDNNSSFSGVSPNEAIVGDDKIFIYIASQTGYYVKENPNYSGPTADEIRAMKDIKQRNPATKAFVEANCEPLLRRQDFVDEYVWFTKDDLAKGIDTVRERAFEIIKGK